MQDINTRAINIKTLIYALLAIIAVFSVVTIFRCNKGDFNFNFPSINMGRDSVVTDIQIDTRPEIDSVELLESMNSQLEELSRKLAELQAENEKLRSDWEHEFGRHYKYKRLALDWEDRYYNLLDTVSSQIINADCDGQLNFLKDQLQITGRELRDRTSMLVDSEKEAQDYVVKYNGLLNEISKQYKTTYSDSLGNGLVLNSEITTDGFPLREGMYQYNLSGRVGTSRMVFGRTNKQLRTQIGLMYGKQGGFRNNIYGLMYARSGRIINLYAMPMYFNTSNDFKFEDFSGDRFGGMVGIGFNFK